MRNLNNKQQLALIIGVFSLVLIGEGVFAYLCWNNRAKAQSSLTRLDRDEKSAKEKKERIPNLNEESAELANIIEEYVKILPSESEVGYDDFLEDVDGFTKDTGLQIRRATSVEIVPPKSKRDPKKKGKTVEEKNSFVQHKYRFELTGTFLGLLKFINAIENHSRFLQVDKIDIAAAGSERGDKLSEQVARAEEPEKSIMVEISTYTYSKPQIEGGAK